VECGAFPPLFVFLLFLGQVVAPGIGKERKKNWETKAAEKRRTPLLSTTVTRSRNGNAHRRWAKFWHFLLVFDASRRLVLDPDEEVQQAVRLLLAVFEQTGSALAVVKHFGKHRLLFPDRLWGKAHDGELLWKPLRHGRVLDVLHNPRYAIALAVSGSLVIPGVDSRWFFVIGGTETSHYPEERKENSIRQ